MSLGGSLHGHPGGTVSGAKAMRQAFELNQDKNLDSGKFVEYKEAVKKWGYIND